MNDATVQSLQQTEAAKLTVLFFAFCPASYAKAADLLASRSSKRKEKQKKQKHRNKTNAYLTTQIRETQGIGPLNTI